MKTYRMTMPKELCCLIFSKMKFVLTRQYESNEDTVINFSNLKLIVEVKENIKLDLFDIAVLHAIHTLYMETNGLRRFRTLNILKIITGNSKAHFASNSLKKKTLNEEQIKQSIHKLSMFNIKQINQTELEISKLVDLNEEADYVEFRSIPCMIDIYEKHLLNSMNISYFPLNALFITKAGGKKYIHQTISVIEFKFYILNEICEMDDSIKIDNKKLKYVLGIDKQEIEIQDAYKKGLLSYDLYRKKIKTLENDFLKKYLLPLLSNMEELCVINAFDIRRDITILMK